MKRYVKELGILLFTLTVAACGILDNLENVTKETRDEVRASKEKIDETKQTQKFGFYYELLMSPDKPYHARVDAAKVVLVRAPLEQLPGVLAPLSKYLDRAAISLELNDAAFDLANVTVVGDRDPKLKVVPMPPDFFDLMTDAVWSSLVSLHDSATTNGKSTEQRDSVIEAFDRMSYAATVLFGATDVVSLHGHVFDGKPVAHAVDTKTREQVARLLQETAEALHYEHDKLAPLYERGRVRLLEGDPNAHFAFPAI